MDALIKHLENREDLEPREIEVAAGLLLDTSVDDGKKERMLTALSKKGETPAEIAGFVEAFLEHAVDPMMDGLELEGDLPSTYAGRAATSSISSTFRPPRCSSRQRRARWS